MAIDFSSSLVPTILDTQNNNNNNNIDSVLQMKYRSEKNSCPCRSIKKRKEEGEGNVDK